MTSVVDEVKVKFDKADATIRVYYPPTKENWTCPSRSKISGGVELAATFLSPNPTCY